MNISATLVLLASGFACALASAQSLQPVANLPGGEKAAISDMSDDGSTLVAQTNTEVFRMRNGTWQSLGTVIGKTPTVVRASSNGDFVLSSMRSIGLPFIEQVHVHRGGAWSSPAASNVSSESHAARFISADGSRVLADRFGADFTQRRVFNWNGSAYVEQSVASAYPSSQFLNSPGFAGIDESSWFGLSSDGLTALATDAGPVGGASAIRYGQSNVAFTRPASITPGDIFFEESSRGQAISSNGQVVYGFYTWNAVYSNTTQSAGQGLFRWTAATGTQLITASLSDFGTTEASANGDFWVLTSGNIYSHAAGAILTPAQLFAASNIDFANWTNLRINQVSSDGLTFAGIGSFNTGSTTINEQAWIVTIPTPGSLAIGALTVFAAARRRR
ncbi:MAG TPA: hypothetical protein VK157_15420 [Phycisphaerales bacterium]|nr:hypothetical protein [Phycisphaerales bacterium]